MTEMERSRWPAALVTGGSRGIGAATALALAQRGYDVALTYRNKEARAHVVAEELAALGARALPVRCDITQADDLTALFAAVRTWCDRLDALILNASGGLERDLVAADPDYPMRINRDAQVATLDAVLPGMGAGGVVVFVTSHWAHRYGTVAQLPVYERIAASKHAGEEALRGRRADLVARGIRLVVVTADVVEGTITPKLIARATPGLAAAREKMAARLVTAAEVGAAIAAAAGDPTLPFGHVVVVGGPLEGLS